MTRGARPRNTERPAHVFDSGLQHERTALAWERTAIAVIVAGLILARYAAVEGAWFLGGVGLAHTTFGAVLLVWTGAHYEQLHGPLRSGDDVIHPVAARVVGLFTIVCTGSALVLAVVITVRH